MWTFNVFNQKKLKRLILIEDDVETWYKGERFFQPQVKREWRGTDEKTHAFGNPLTMSLHAGSISE